MTLQNQARIFEFFDENIEAAKQKRLELLADNRNDEADFENIRGNIFGIFKTIFSVAVKNAEGDFNAIHKFFCLKVEDIPSNWKISYSKAKEHGDIETMQIEKIKLDTLEEIKAAFERIWGENNE